MANTADKFTMADGTDVKIVDSRIGDLTSTGITGATVAAQLSALNQRTTNFHPDQMNAGGYIGRKIEGGGTIFFDYAIGFKGDITVAKKSNLHSYHVDYAKGGVVVCDDPSDTSKAARFYVVSDHDIGAFKHGTCLMWSKGTTGSLYTTVGTSTGFGTGYSNTEKCIAKANTDGILEWNNDAYASIWHYVWKGDWSARNPKWFVPSKDELNVLLCMQWHDASRRKSADGSVQLIQLPINFYPYYWSSSEASATTAHDANFNNGSMYTNRKNNADNCAVRLVRTF